MNNKVSYTSFIKSTAKRLGFEFCGVAKVQKLDDDARRLESWLSQGMNAEMKYMENYFDLRIDPSRLVPGAKSVITLLQNYYPEKQQLNNENKISKYAYGNDYHEVIKAKLHEFLFEINNEIGEVSGRGFVDSAPVLERTWAQKSGLGWLGKNGNLIVKNAGSFYFIATLIVDIELEYDNAFVKDFCGTCTKCIDACPTDAILMDKKIDGSKCISYHTIELKESIIDNNFKGKFDNWMFGCDTCQDVCPWNRFSKSTTEAGFTPLPEILNFTTKQWEELTEESFKNIFKHSPIKRSKFSGLKRNLKFIQQA